MQKIVAGNWKMNKTARDARDLFNEIISRNLNEACEVVIFPPSVYLSEFGLRLNDSKLKLGCQNVYHKQQGAYTGEVSADILASIGVKYCLVGHSERRKYFHVSDQLCLEKSKLLLNEKIRPVLCVGEELEVREHNKQLDWVKKQINGVFKNINRDEALQFIIAYEPVWAIGTGKTASVQQAVEMHQFIYSCIEDLFGGKTAGQIPLLYGGSVNENNAFDLMKNNEISGVLVGGASLKASSFLKIIESV